MEFSTYKDERGLLSAAELPADFHVKRIFWIDAPKGALRGQHGHYKNQMYLILQFGNIELQNIHTSGERQTVHLTEGGAVTFIDRNVWHEIRFKERSLVLCLNTHAYDQQDYYYK